MTLSEAAFNPKSKTEILGVLIDNLSLQEVLAKSQRLINSGQQHFIVTPNPEFIVAAQHDQRFKEILNYADIAVADGFGLILAAKVLNKKLMRVTGIDLLSQLTSLSAQRGWPVYFLGGGPDIAARTAQTLNKQHTNLIIAGAVSGGVITDPAKIDQAVIQAINRAQPKILFVAFGHGKQEKWIFHHLDKLPSVKLAVGVGGAFDYIAGVTKRSPILIQQLGLEWLWRLIHQSWRWKRIITAVIIFPLLVAKQKFFKTAQ